MLILEREEVGGRRKRKREREREREREIDRFKKNINLLPRTLTPTRDRTYKLSVYGTMLQLTKLPG